MTRRELLTVAGAVGLAAGSVVAARWAFAPFEQRAAWFSVASLCAIGWSGLLAWLRVPASRIGPLVVGAAVVATITLAVAPLVSDSVPAAALLGSTLSIGLLVQAGLTTPLGRVADRSTAVAVVLGYGAALLASADVGLALAVLAVTWLLVALVRRRGRTGAVAVLVLAAGAILPPADVPGAGGDGRVVAALAAALAAVLLVAPLVAAADRRRRILDVVASIDEPGGAARLGRLLREPDLRIELMPAARTRATGPPVLAPVEPADDAGRRSSTRTEVTSDGVPIAFVEHRPGALDDRPTADAISSAVRLLATQARLRADVADQLRDVRASRGRLVAAADAENLALRAELEDRLEPRFATLAAGLEAVDPALLVDADRAGPATGPVAQLEAAREDIGHILAGLPPRDVGGAGLGGALRSLAGRSPVPVTVSVTDDGPAWASATAALYFVAAEGLTNVVRHAAASRVEVTLARDGDASTVVIDDDGVGGASPSGGTGLLGLDDRVTAIGGTLTIGDSPRGGTRLRAAVPRAEAAPA